jgi:AraC-like DNA-binding protein
MRRRSGMLAVPTSFRTMPFPRPHHREFTPPAPLRDAVKCFWYDSRSAQEAASDFHVLPDGYAEIIFTFGGACSVLREGGWQGLPSPFMMGLLDQPATLRADGRLDILAIRCLPWAVFDLLGLPASRGAMHVLDHPVAQLQAVLAQAVLGGRVEEGVASLAAFLADARTAPGTAGLLSKAGAAMSAAHGTLPVSAVATAAHSTVRTLERKFKQSSGHTVKDVSGLMRFEQVRNRLFVSPDACIAALAQELGYTDQSHLSREFKRYSGTTPAAFARMLRLSRLSKPGG